MAFTSNLHHHPRLRSGQSATVTPFVPRTTAKTETQPETFAGTISPAIVSGSARIADFLLLALIGIAAAYVCDGPASLFDLRYGIAALTAAAVSLGMFEAFGLYSTRALARFLHNTPSVLIGWTLVVVALGSTVHLFNTTGDMSLTWLSLWYVAGASALITGRIVLSQLSHQWTESGRLCKRAVVYGIGPVTEQLIADLEADYDKSVKIIGVFDDRKNRRAQQPIAGYPRLGGIDELVQMSRTSRPDIIVVALPLSAEDRVSSLAKRLSVLPADIKMPAQTTSLRFSQRTYSHVGPVAMIDIYDKPLADWAYVAKWLFDKIFGAIALVALAPVMAIVAIAVKLDSPGPILFRQKRYGFNNELIEVFKFRSMYTDRCDASAAKLVTKNDSRVTRVGRIIRKTSLDELPQLFNVLFGDLSLVGPRPHAVQAKAGTQLYDEVVDDYFARHKVKPGITGWAQINGWRGETETEEQIKKRVEHDLYYIENWSVFFDLYILVKTPISLLKTDRAY
jgi:Undecaprenyl-phosphate glucose phosphotransferase